MSHEPQHLSSRPTVLVIEDDAVTRRVVAAIFSEADWDVVEAENGDEALRVIASQDVDLVLLDLTMPVLDGFAFLDCLNQDLRPRSQAIPVVLLTGRSVSDRDRERFRGRVSLMVEKQAGPAGMHRQLKAVAQAYRESARPDD